MDFLKLIFARLFIFGICLILTACGFKLRGQHVIAPNLHCVKLASTTPYGDFESTMRRSLTQLGVNVTRNGQAPVTLRILGSSLFQDVPTIGGSSQARVFVYYFTVTFILLDQRNQPLIPQRTVLVSESLITCPGTALEATNQIEVLKQQMREEAAHMVINILNSPQVSHASCP